MKKRFTYHYDNMLTYRNGLYIVFSGTDLKKEIANKQEAVKYFHVCLKCMDELYMVLDGWQKIAAIGLTLESQIELLKLMQSYQFYREKTSHEFYVYAYRALFCAFSEIENKKMVLSNFMTTFFALKVGNISR